MPIVKFLSNPVQCSSIYLDELRKRIKTAYICIDGEWKAVVDIQIADQGEWKGMTT